MGDSPRPVEALIEWFRETARDLPWRSTPRDPYAVLVSEAMLQQTQVDRVVPKFEAFLERFPGPRALAAADESDVLEAWSGLGYYRRARLLHRAAKAIVARGGEFPRDVAALRSLPGVGPYTAAAVASLAFGASEPVLDGNVIRVASRVLTFESDPRTADGARALRAWVKDVFIAHHDDPGEVNEALMELGATVCRPRAPSCLLCPLRDHCLARLEGRQQELPTARKTGRALEAHRWVAAICVDEEGCWALREVLTGPILRGLWLPPIDWDAASGEAVARARALSAPLDLQDGVALPPVTHGITHRRITIVPVLFHVERESMAEDETLFWAPPGSPGKPTSSLLAKLAARVGEAEQEAS